MKLIRVTYLAIVTLAFGSSALGMTQQVMNTYNRISISTGLKYIDYDEKGSEPNDPAVLDSERGIVPKVTMELMTHINHFVLGGGLSLSRGIADYDGFLEGFDEEDNLVLIPSKGRSKQTFVQLYLHTGYLFNVYDGLLEPFIEGRWRRWHRGTLPVPTPFFNENNEQQIVPINGYAEIYSHYRIAAGLTYTKQLTSQWLGQLSAIIGHTINPQMITDIPFGEFGIGTIYTKNRLGTRLDGTVRLQLNRRITQNVDFLTAISYRHFNYGKSKIDAAGGLEPSSKTDETTVSVGLQFALA